MQRLIFNGFMVVPSNEWGRVGFCYNMFLAKVQQSPKQAQNKPKD